MGNFKTQPASPSTTKAMSMFPKVEIIGYRIYFRRRMVGYLGSRGSGDGEFLSAMVVAADGDGNLYVSDWGNSRIQVFDVDGAFLETRVASGIEPGELTTPTGLKIDGDGHLWVVDRGNNRVQKFTIDGEFLTSWGVEGDGHGFFRVPTSIAIDGDGNFYVAEVDNSRVQIFSPTGEFLSELAPGFLSMPHGLALDSAGNLSESSMT